jgi:hypothetical protein
VIRAVNQPTPAPFGFRATDDEDEPTPHGPSFLWLFGECGHRSVQIIFGDNSFKLGYGRQQRELTPSELIELARIKRLFPEADVKAIGWAQIEL